MRVVSHKHSQRLSEQEDRRYVKADKTYDDCNTKRAITYKEIKKRVNRDMCNINDLK